MSIGGSVPVAFTARVHSSMLARARCAAGSSARPAVDRRTLRVVRTKSCAPSWSSSCLMRWPNAAGVSATARDAARKLRNLAAAAKHRSDSTDGRFTRAEYAEFGVREREPARRHGYEDALRDQGHDVRA